MHIHALRTPSESADGGALAARLLAVRRESERLAAGLTPEDQVVQSMPDCSPTKWHLAHVTWFFETFLLAPYLPGYRPLHPQYAYLFNSYYVTAGARYPRPHRGLLTRPTADEVAEYRRHVTDGLAELLGTADGALLAELEPLVEIGINHEQQHQELMLMDVLHLFSCNPLKPAFAPPLPTPARQASRFRWIEYGGGIHTIGHDGDGFAYDNEGPRHEVLLRPFRIASRPVSNGEWLEFVEDGGYQRPELWLSDGWATATEEGWSAPLYWERGEGGWTGMTLTGQQPIDPHAPVCHVSHYEADAYARWLGHRLPTEAEWEVAAQECPEVGNFLDSGLLRPVAADDGSAGPVQMFGDVWEWTGSAYGPYPGYRPPEGTIGEYNGKFMANQIVLRGGCCVTPAGHARRSYRNFFYPRQRWAFGGLRLAEDC